MGLSGLLARALARRNWMFANWTMTSAKHRSSTTPNQRMRRPIKRPASWHRGCGGLDWWGGGRGGHRRRGHGRRSRCGGRRGRRRGSRDVRYGPRRTDPGRRRGLGLLGGVVQEGVLAVQILDVVLRILERRL